MDKQIIIHIDMDAFYAAVEERDNEELKGKPLIIGSLPNERGVVCTCNYEARKYGIHSAMNIKEAYNRCPKAIFMRPNFYKYKNISNKIHNIWKEYSGKIEYISLDEGYIDLTDEVKNFEEAIKIAQIIKERIKKELRLTCSAGIGYSLMSAKISSEENKPNGLFCIMNKKELTDLIIDRPVSVIYGVGKKNKEKLFKLGIKKVRDIYSNEIIIRKFFKTYGEYIINMAKGDDYRKVKPYDEREVKSIARERTFQDDIKDIDTLKEILMELCKDVSLKLKNKDKIAKTVTLKITYANMKSITRSKTYEAGNDYEYIYNLASKLLDDIDHNFIRLIGVSVSNFIEEKFLQMSMNFI